MKSISRLPLLLLICLVFTLAQARKLRHHSKSTKDDHAPSSSSSTAGKSIKSVIVPVGMNDSSSSSSSTGSKSGKSSIVATAKDDVDTDDFKEVKYDGGKSTKASPSESSTIVIDDEDDMSEVEIMTTHSNGKSDKISNSSQSSHSVPLGKSEKGSVTSITTAGKATKVTHHPENLSMSISNNEQTVIMMGGGGKSGKALTNFFVKTSSSSDRVATGGKSDKKGTEIKTIHTETTDIMYVHANDIERIKTKSGKADEYSHSATSKGGKGSSSGTVSQVVTVNNSSKSSKSQGGDATDDPTASPTVVSTTETGSTSVAASTTETGSTTVAASTTAAVTGTEAITTESGGNTLLTLAPTPTGGLKETKDASIADPSSSSTYAPTSNPTYFPTSYDESTYELSNGGEQAVAINPFSLNLSTNDSESPKLDIETVQIVTMEHLLHSFRNAYSSDGYIVNRLKLMILDPEGERGRRRLENEQYELFFGGILYFEAGTPTPSMDEIDSIVKASFTSDRLDYYVNLLQEANMDVGSVSYVNESTDSGNLGGGKIKALSVGLASAFGVLGMLATGVHLYKRRQSSFDLNGVERDEFVIKLKDEAQVEEFPGTETVANTENDSTIDDRSIPSAVGDDFPSLSSRSLDAIEQETIDPRISPLEEPESPTRYVSIFTVKKDVQGKSLEEIDLRSLAIAYLSKMLRRFPNTFLLPYDKESSLPPITNIRIIPDSMEELSEYIGK